MKREWFSLFVSSPKLISFIFFYSTAIFFAPGVDMVRLVVYNSVCQQGFGRLC
nr:MAG TPA: hypothetical protein [Caudoviricetes sp.]